MGGFLPLLLGIGLWAGFLLLAPAGDPHTGISRILALAILIISPLALGLSRAPDEHPTHAFSTAMYLQPFAGLVAAASFLLPPGVLAGTLAIAWLPVTGLIALDAANRIRRRGLGPLEELAVDVGGLYLPVGAIWLWVSRMGLEPFGFTEPIVLLTAVHFHYAGYAGPVLAGLAGRQLRRSGNGLPITYALSSLLILIGPVSVAAGFFLPAPLEAAAGLALAAGYAGLALITLFNVLRSLDGPLPKLLLALSAVSILLAMAAAAAYALGNASRAFFIPITTMTQVHGWLNAVGFAGLGLAGWALAAENKKRP